MCWLYRLWIVKIILILSRYLWCKWILNYGDKIQSFIKFHSNTCHGLKYEIYRGGNTRQRVSDWPMWDFNLNRSLWTWWNIPSIRDISVYIIPNFYCNGIITNISKTIDPKYSFPDESHFQCQYAEHNMFSCFGMFCRGSM
jgi:hypothetical protein